MRFFLKFRGGYTLWIKTSTKTLNLFFFFKQWYETLRKCIPVDKIRSSKVKRKQFKKQIQISKLDQLQTAIDGKDISGEVICELQSHIQEGDLSSRFRQASSLEKINWRSLGVINLVKQIKFCVKKITFPSCCIFPQFHIYRFLFGLLLEMMNKLRVSHYTGFYEDYYWK